jgi:hypothetical protein
MPPARSEAVRGKVIGKKDAAVIGGGNLTGGQEGKQGGEGFHGRIRTQQADGSLQQLPEVVG